MPMIGSIKIIDVTCTNIDAIKSPHPFMLLTSLYKKRNAFNANTTEQYCRAPLIEKDMSDNPQKRKIDKGRLSDALYKNHNNPETIANETQNIYI